MILKLDSVHVKEISTENERMGRKEYERERERNQTKDRRNLKKVRKRQMREPDRDYHFFNCGKSRSCPPTRTAQEYKVL